MILKFTSLNSKLAMECSPPPKSIFRFKRLLLLPLLVCFLSFYAQAQDPPTFTTCPGNPSITLPAGNGGIVLNSTNIPTLLGVAATDPNGGAITYSATPSTITCTDIGGPFALNITATDIESMTDMCPISVIVLDGGPFVSCQTFTANVGAAGNVVVNPTDIEATSSACTGPTLTKEISKDGITYTPTITYTCAEIGSQTAWLRITDNAVGGALTSFCNVSITVQDGAAPVLVGCPVGDQSTNSNAGLDAITGDCRAQLQITHPTITDNCTPASTLSVAFSNGTPAPTALPTGGTATAGTMLTDYFAVGQTIVTYTATDNNAPSGTTTCSYTITVVDNEAPVITTCPPARTVEGCGTAQITNGGFTAQAYSTTDVTVTSAQFIAEGGVVAENCTATYKYSDAVAGTCPYVVTRTWTVTKAGTSVTCAQTISIDDTILPSITTCPPAREINLNATCQIIVPDMTTEVVPADACATTVTQSPAAGMALASADAMTHTITMTVMDVCLNATTCTVTLTGNDNSAPILSTPTNQTLVTSTGGTGDCDGQLNWNHPTISDACTLPIIYTVNYSDDNTTVNITSGGAEARAFPVGTTTVTYLATDSATPANSATTSFTVIVTDDEAPTASCHGTATVTLDGTGNGTLIVGDVDNGSTDNCGLATANPLTLSQSAFDCSHIGTAQTVTLTVTDANGGTATCTTIVTVEDGEAATISCGAPGAINTMSFTSTPALCIPSSTTTTDILNVSGLPADAIITDVKVTNLDLTHSWIGDISIELEGPGSTVGLISMPGTGFGGCDDNNILAGFEDGAANSSADLHLLCNTTTQPGCSCASQQACQSGAPYAISDPTDPTFSTKYVAEAINSFSSFIGQNPNGNWNLNVNDAVGGDDGVLETWTLEISYTTSLDGDIVTNNDAGLCGASVSYPAPATADNCSTPSVSQTSGLPSGSFFPVGTTTNTFEVTDAGGNITSCSFDITVNDAEPPTFTGFPSSTVLTATTACQANHTWTDPVPTDNCSANIISQTHVSPAVFPLGTTIVSYTVQDASGNVFSQNFTVTVNDAAGTPPNAECEPTNLTFDAAGLATFTVGDIDDGSTDNCGVPILTMLIDLDGDGVYGNTVAEGPFTSTSPKVFSCAEAGNYNVQLTATDGTSSSTCISTVTVDDVTDPIAICKDITVSVGANQFPVSVNAIDIDNISTDNCSNLTYAIDGLSSLSFDCADIGPNVVTLTVTDGSNNTATCTSTITIEDNTPPTVNFGSTPGTINAQCATLDADTTGSAANLFVFDFCGGVGVNFTETSTQSGNANSCTNYNYTITKTWVATDNSGNTNSFAQLINVSDTEAPANAMFSATGPDGSFVDGETINTNPADCFATVALTLTSVDDCAPLANLTITNSEGVGMNASGNYAIGIYDVAYEITDPCGNIALDTFSFAVTDGLAPVASCVNSLNLGLPSSGTLVLAPTAVDNNSFDNCTAQQDLILSISPNTFTCADVGMTIPVTLTVSDGSLSSSCNTTVTIQENNAPTAVCQNITIPLDIDGNATITGADVDGGSFDDCALAANPFSVSPNTFTLADAGTNLVTLTVTDAQGNTSTCNSVVTVVLPPTCFNIGFAAGGAGEIVSVPVTVEDFTALTSFQFMLNLQDTSAGVFAGISNVNPVLTNLTQSTLFSDSIATNDTLSVTIEDIVDGMGDPYDGILDSVVVEYDTLYENNRMSVAWSQNDLTQGTPILPIAITLADNEIAFYIDVLLTGELGDSSYVEILNGSSITPPEVVYNFGTPDFYPTAACWTQGQVQIGELIITGLIYTLDGGIFSPIQPGKEYQGVPNPALPVGQAIVEVYNDDLPTNTMVGDDVTAADGLYSITLASLDNYTIEPQKDINFCNGLDVADVSAIQQHAIGFDFFPNSYLKIAADIYTLDNAVTTLDATLLLQQVINACTNVPAPAVDSWVFIDAAETLPFSLDAIVPPYRNYIELVGLNSDALDQNFIGIKKGNVVVNNPFNPNGFTGGSSIPTLTFKAAEATLVAGETYAVSLTSNEFTNILAYQLAFDFDKAHLSFEGFSNAALTGNGSAVVSENFLTDGLLPHAWYNHEGVDIAADTELVQFSFKALTSGELLSEVLNIVDINDFNSVAYDAEYNMWNTELVFGASVVNTTEVEGGFTLYQNQPNPFKESTLISFNLPVASEGSIAIMDATGRVLKVIEGSFVQGYNEVSLDRNELNAVGVLFYELKTETHTATRKMILLDNNK